MQKNVQTLSSGQPHPPHKLIIVGLFFRVCQFLNAVATPEVYTVIPPQPSEKKPGQLEQWQLEQYFDKGFVVLPNFFTNEEMQSAIEVSVDHSPFSQT